MCEYEGCNFHLVQKPVFSLYDLEEAVSFMNRLGINHAEINANGDLRLHKTFETNIGTVLWTYVPKDNTSCVRLEGLTIFQGDGIAFPANKNPFEIVRHLLKDRASALYVYDPAENRSENMAKEKTHVHLGVITDFVSYHGFYNHPAHALNAVRKYFYHGAEMSDLLDMQEARQTLDFLVQRTAPLFSSDNVWEKFVAFMHKMEKEDDNTI